MPLFLKRSIPDPAFITMNNLNWQKPNQTNQPNKQNTDFSQFKSDHCASSKEKHLVSYTSSKRVLKYLYWTSIIRCFHKSRTSFLVTVISDNAWTLSSLYFSQVKMLYLSIRICK